MSENKTKEFVVYRICHVDTGKSYIGITGDYKRRIRDHFRSKDNYYIHRAIQKHSEEKFITEIIFECDSFEKAKKEEKEYISVFDTKIPNGYNMTDGGDGMLGYKFSKEACRKMSEVRKGRIASEETKQKLSISHSGEKNAFYGKEHSEKTKKLIGQKSKGRKHSKETLRLMSEGNKGKFVSVETRKKLSESALNPSKKTRKKLSKSAKNRLPISEETRKKLSESHKNPLSNNQILEIKKMLSENIVQRIIAKKFNIHVTSISRIKLNKVYADIQLSKEA